MPRFVFCILNKKHLFKLEVKYILFDKFTGGRKNYIILKKILYRVVPKKSYELI